MKTNRKGFTLVEIMIVVAIIGILAAIAIPNFLRSRKESQKNACIANLKQIEGAMQQWYLAGNPAAPGATTDIVGPEDTKFLLVWPYCPTDKADYAIPTAGSKPVCPGTRDGHTLDKPVAAGG